MRYLALATTTAAMLFGVAGCGAGGRASTHEAPIAVQAPRAADPPSRPAHPGGVVRVIRTAYGRALVDRRGFALYLFTHDRSAASTCFGACAVAWPPYELAPRPRAAAAGGVVSTTPRGDGRFQVTYAGHPLYYYVGDKRPGEVLCQGVEEFGGTWYVVAPEGSAIR